jgi:hypothetical protein
LIIFLLGYVPDRAYYFTVSPTLDVGFNAISPINLCPAERRGARSCPAPAAGWRDHPVGNQPDRARAAGGRSGAWCSAGSTLYLIGGETVAGATSSVLTTTVSDDGNLAIWTQGARCGSRSHAAVLNLAGVPYVIGGLDASSQPTQTVYRHGRQGASLAGRRRPTSALPAALSDAVGTSTASGLYLFGGRTADGLSAKTWFSECPRRHQSWELDRAD